MALLTSWRIVGAPASGTPEGSARREFELLLLLGGSRKAAVQLWLRKQRIYAEHITNLKKTKSSDTSPYFGNTPAFRLPPPLGRAVHLLDARVLGAATPPVRHRPGSRRVGHSVPERLLRARRLR